MNRNKYQLEVCKAMLDKNRMLSGWWISNDEYAISVDGYRAFVFDRQDIVFDTAKIVDRIGNRYKQLFDLSDKDVPLRITCEIRRISKQGIYKIKLEADNGSFEMWARNTAIQDVEQYRLYAAGHTGRILAVDAMGRAIGVVMPVRVPDKGL